MRILSISGQNIASLSDPFEIDFTSPPLNGLGDSHISEPPPVGEGFEVL
jgi:hypothetical protein